MATARFYMMGNVEITHSITVQDAIAKNGLAGSVITMRPNKMAVVVEGSEKNIRTLHATLTENDLADLTLTDLEMRKDSFVEERPISREDFEVVVSYLKEIERNLRRINMRLGALEQGVQPIRETHSSIDYYSEQKEEERKEYSWDQKEEAGETEQESGSVLSDFFNN
ncbi:MAG: hypothetical protein ABH950_03930 [Candidatus Altiarchaeota archaeon]